MYIRGVHSCKPYYYCASRRKGVRSKDVQACVHYTFLYLTRVVVCTLFAYVIRFSQMERDIHIRAQVCSRVYTYNIHIFVYVMYVYDEAMATARKRNFSEIQKSNPRRRDNSINKKAERQKTQASKLYVDCSCIYNIYYTHMCSHTYVYTTYVTVQSERTAKRTAKPERVPVGRRPARRRELRGVR